MKRILETLYKYQDSKIADFNAKLIPNVPRELFIGVRTPMYKKIVKEISLSANDEVSGFMNELPHSFFEENFLHSVFISKIEDFDEWVRACEAFFPFIDNWAVSDSMDSKILKQNHEKLILKIREWILSEKPYTMRIAMLFLKKEFLEEDFKSEYLDWVCDIQSSEYYVNMMRAWLFADALVKQWDCALDFLQKKKLDRWTHNKAIQKARESFRIDSDKKEFLNSLKIKK
ncbi:DNA alkylation repair protein [Treponema pectinovorum]|uniref:DNA alkylation repair protein n=1 Tax=Treponema pectinovorum TaxID=164 RepID=UPI0011C98254|nr:DNA alkylation repair protein [Treponema pectinovorum]